MEEHRDVFLDMLCTQCVSLTQRTDWVTSEQRLALTGRIPTCPIPAPETPESRHRGSTAEVLLIPEPSSRWILEQLYQRSSTSSCQKCRSIRVWQNGREHVLDQPGALLSAASTPE